MARIRTVKPDFWRDDDLSSVSAEAALLAIGLLNISDDEGYFKANPKLIEADIFPLRELSSTTTGMIKELTDIGYIELFDGSDGKKYGYVNNFTKHQVISKPKPSEIKGLKKKESNSSTSPVLVPSGKEGKGKGKEGERKGKDLMSATTDDAKIILAFLNEATTSKFKPVATNINLIKARLNENHSVDELKEVVLMKTAEWQGGKMEQYLRPATLFNAEKFNQYVGGLAKWREESNDEPNWLDGENIIEGEFAHG